MRLKVTGFQTDFIMSYLRSQICSLEEIVGLIEGGSANVQNNNGYIQVRLRQVEKNINRLRKWFVN
jgi:hypothetical protein